MSIHAGWPLPAQPDAHGDVADETSCLLEDERDIEGDVLSSSVRV